MKKIMLLFAGLAFIVSCVHEGMRNSCQDSGKVMITVRPVVDGSGSEASTRSVLPVDEIEYKVTDLTLASYDENGMLVDAQYYTDLSDIRLYVSKSGDNDLFALANMGDMTASMPSSADDVPEVVYMMDSYSEVLAKGIPMCASVKVSPTMPGFEIRLVRLFAKVNVRILHTSLDNSSSLNDYAFNLCNKSLYIRQANGRLYPFSPLGSRALGQNDVMDVSDCNSDMNDRTVHPDPSVFGPGPGYWQDTTIVLYVPENMQGCLLPANTDPFRKTGENISSINGNDYSSLCTYLELNAQKEGIGTGLSGGITYRCYLGADNVSDFNVERNGRYDVTMDITQDSFGMENWKVVKGDDWTDTRSLAFLEDSYVIYPGRTRDVFVHYNAVAGLASDSQMDPDAWTYLFDEDKIASAGLSYTYDPAGLVTSVGSRKDFCFRFTASESATVGACIPLTVMTRDGFISDESMIYVEKMGELSLDWKDRPSYVAQCGIVTVDGVLDEALPLTATASDPSVLNITQVGDDSFKVVALRPGISEIAFANSDGTQTCSTTISVDCPLLSVTTGAVALNPDGAPTALDYCYLDSRGLRLSGFDDEAFRTYLRPVVSGGKFFRTELEADKVTVMIDRLHDDDMNEINLGSYYNISFAAADCRGAGSKTVRAYVIDPFDDIAVADYGRIDDYTLFSLKGTDPDVSAYFKDHDDANLSFEYEAPEPDADPAYIQAVMVPEWSSGYSYANEVFSVSYDHDDPEFRTGASFTVTRNQVTDVTSHGAGIHDIMLYVVNRHSQEKTGCVCGKIRVYVHTALGARAVFGNQRCNYKPEGSHPSEPVFAAVYNSLTGRTLYSEISGEKIYYMDVNVEFLTDVDGVYVLSRLVDNARLNSNVLDALNIVRPDVSDGYADPNTGLLYSVNGSGGYRVTAAGEEYGGRKGIGVMLYRALRMQTYSDDHTESELHQWFFGLNINNVANRVYDSRYGIHDMNKSTDMSLNMADRNLPYHFAPSAYPERTDADGHGYHVIHFLEEMYPDTGGWINLL